MDPRWLSADAERLRDEAERSADLQSNGAAPLVPRDDAPQSRAVSGTGKRAVVNRHYVESLRAQARNVLRSVPDGPSRRSAHGERGAQFRYVLGRS